MHKISRRDFAKLALGVAITSISSSSIASIGFSRGKRFAMYIDVSKCYGCYACMVACAAENNVPVGVFRTWIERHVRSDGTIIFVPKQCNHCDNPPCVKPCPTGATYVNEDGLVLVDDNKCIGCGACVTACPYGARYKNPVKGVVDKCTFCDHRIYDGLLPACVEACPTGARVFGSLTTEGSEVRRLVDRNPVQVLKPEYGAKPMIFYRDLPEVANL
ncbi:MAG: 4Fe-4S dicluster domain-containing protein [Acidilobaceae archaeon]